MLGDINPARITVQELSSVVYAGRDNVTSVRFVQYDPALRRSVPLDLSGVERIVVVLPELDVVFDSDAVGVFDWSEGNGLVKIDLSEYALQSGVYDAQVVMFDADHPRGQVVVSGYQTDRDFKLSFQSVEGTGGLPPPHIEWTPEAPVDGVLYGRKNKRWVELTPSELGAATEEQGALADTAVQPDDLAPVATSGSYNDLDDKPALGTAAATDATDYATAAQGEKADSAVQPGDIADVVRDADPRLTDSRTPTGGAGGVLSGSYPNPGFAVDMATQAELEAAIDTRIPTTARGAAMGVASLGADGRIPESELPAIAITDTFSVASQAAMLALTAERGDIAIRTDLNKTFALAAEPASTLANWLELRTPTDAVLSVAGKTGAVTLVKGDVGLGNVDNTSDAAKPVSTAQQAALNLKLDATATAADSSKLGGQLPAYYATAAQVGDIATALDLLNGEVI